MYKEKLIFSYHDMFPSKYNPEGEKHGIECSLSDVVQEQHEGHV